MNTDDLWKTVKDDLRVSISDSSFATLLAQTQLSDVSETDLEVNAIVSAMSSFHLKMLEQRYGGQIQDALRRVTGKTSKVHFIVSRGVPSQNAFGPSAFGPLFSHQEDNAVSYHQAAQRAHLRSDFTFEQFAVSTTNEMAYAAAQAVSRNPGQAYHLLFLFGGVGVGKTHLMQGIAHRILEKNPATKTIYCSGEQFTNEIVEAIRDKTTAEFRKKYRPVQLLLIDDIQFIGGKDKVQEEFFHTFNAIHQEGGQIVLTSDKLPREIEGLEDRLRSRFEGGLTIDIQKPSFELRAAIILLKAKAWGIDLSMEIAQFIAANIDDTRQLEGVLKRLMVETDTHKEPITQEVAAEIIKSVRANGQNSIDEKSTARLTPQAVLSAVSSVFSIKIPELKGHRRQRELVTPRHLAMYILCQEGGMPYIRVAEAFGGRDHTTVMHAATKITNALVTDARLRGALTEVRKLLQQK